MSYRYQAQVGRHIICSDAPFDVTWTRTIGISEENGNKFYQEAKPVYYRTEDYSPKRQKEQTKDHNRLIKNMFNKSTINGDVNLYFNK